MGRVLVDREYIEKIRQKDRFDFGKEANCYLLEDNKVYKIFHLMDGKRKIYFDELKNDQIAFPEDILIDKETDLIVGYTSKLLSGEKFYDGFHDNLSLKDLKEAYLKTRIIMLKLLDVYMDDNCLDNMLYDYQLNKINLIDTSRWYPKKNGNIESICDFNWQMTNALLKSIDWKHYKLNQDKRLFELYMTYQYLENIPSLFLEYINELELKSSEYKGYKVKTIKDLRI